MSTQRKITGAAGEELACGYLRNEGHTILERNWRVSHLETDIITIDSDGIHFVEVKTRNAPAVADPEDNVDSGKRRRMVRAAAAYMRGPVPPRYKDSEIFFDVLSIVLSGDRAEIEYFKQAFIPTYA